MDGKKGASYVTRMLRIVINCEGLAGDLCLDVYT